MYYFLQHSEKAEKWPNGRTILFLADSFKKGQMATLFVTDDGTESRRSRDELQKKLSNRLRMDLLRTSVFFSTSNGLLLLEKDFITLVFENYLSFYKRGPYLSPIT